MDRMDRRFVRFGSWLGAGFLILAAAFAVANTCEPSTLREAAPSVSGATSAGASLPLPPLTAPAPIVPLAVEGFASALVAVPRGATGPRPIVIVLHGDEPLASYCADWAALAGERPFVLCPSAQPRAGDQPRATELRTALTALKRRFGPHVSPGPVVLAGSAHGAIEALEIARQEPSFFQRLVLVDQGADQLSSGVVTILRDAGGRRLLLVCRQEQCSSIARARAAMAARIGLATRMVGPADDWRTAIRTHRGFRWLVEDDSRFTDPSPPPTSSVR